jgi:hypothetical protein
MESGFGVSREEGISPVLIVTGLLGSLLIWAAVFRRAFPPAPPGKP